jgi:hypothetical protein
LAAPSEPTAPLSGQDYRAAILSGIVGGDPRLAESRARIFASVEAMPDTATREHQPTHVVSSRWPVYALGSRARHHIHAREYTVHEPRGLVEAAGFDATEVSTLDYGIAPPHPPIPGFGAEDRGETIYLAARKAGSPRYRGVKPVYLETVPFAV